jgi:hypothetical protein
LFAGFENATLAELKESFCHGFTLKSKQCPNCLKIVPKQVLKNLSLDNEVTSL